MNILVTGGGGREHALAWAVSQEARINNLYIAPGNPGTAEVGENIDIPVTDTAGHARFARQKNIDFAIVGPDGMLADGMVDAFEAAGVPVFGPTRAAAQIEWSKEFAKAIMQEEGVPTARYQAFGDPVLALRYLTQGTFPQYVKADGLMAGKGAVEVSTIAQGERVLYELLRGQGSRVIIEEHLGGPEVTEISLHALSDGTARLMLPPSQDHKTVREDHKGPMTGGMGAAAPLPGASAKVVEAWAQQIIDPALRGLRELGTPFRGLLYPSVKLGLSPKVVEYNARFGDPEAQVYARLAEKGFLDALIATREGGLDQVDLRWRNMAAVCVVLASAGYPGSYKTGAPIEGIQDANQVEGVHVFHAGTAKENGQLVTNGGRVLNVTALGDTLQQAIARAYEGVSNINFQGMQFRTDIGAQALRGIGIV